MQATQKFELILKHGALARVDGIYYSINGRPAPNPCILCAADMQEMMRGSVALRHGSIIDIGCCRLIFASFFS